MFYIFFCFFFMGLSRSLHGFMWFNIVRGALRTGFGGGIYYNRQELSGDTQTD